MDLSCRTLLVVSKKIDTLQFPNNTLSINTFWWINSLTSPYIYTSTMRSSIKNRFCDLKKKSKFYITLWFITWQTLEPTFAMRVLFCLVKRKFWKKKRKKKEKDRAIRDYVCTVTTKIPRWHSRYDTDFPRVFRLASKRNEERYYD